MKKLFLALSLILMLVSCKIPSDTTVVNNSSRTVSFLYSHTDKKIKTLNPNTSISADYFFNSIIILQPEKRVKQDRELNSSIITISDLPSWEVHVENKTDNLITLTANGWMDEINIPVGDFVDLPEQKGIIYTNKPQFSVASNTFPYDVQWQFVDDIFYVLIRK
jgi:hypothetical protein